MRSLVHVVAAAVCVLGVTGCGGSGSGEQSVSPPPAPTEAVTPPAASDRAQAPAVAGVSLDGDPLSLAKYRGRPVLVNVWSSW